MPIEPYIRLPQRSKHFKVTAYWFKHYRQNKLCVVCAGRGIFDTRGIMAADGTIGGAIEYCFCPVGQSIRIGLKNRELTEKDLPKNVRS